MTVKRIKFKFIQIKARTSGSCLIEGKLNSLETDSKVVQVVVAFGVVGLRRDEEQAGLPEEALHLEFITKRLLKVRTFWPCLIGRKFNSLKRGEVVQVVVADEVVGLVGVDDEQSGSPEKAFPLGCIMNVLLKTRTFWSRLIERKLNSLKRGKVVHEEQAESPEKALHLECIMNVLIT